MNRAEGKSSGGQGSGAIDPAPHPLARTSFDGETVSKSAARNQGRIFISYRREDTAYAAGWLFDRLVEHFGSVQVFKDVDSIELGDDFVEVITTAVASCDVLLALIGGDWVSITDDQGNRRLDNPEDFVRLEIEAALARNVLVIPILVEGAMIPRPDELPASLGALVRHQALELSPSRFDFDTNRLVSLLNKVLGDVRSPTADGSRSVGTSEEEIGPGDRAQTRTQSTGRAGGRSVLSKRAGIRIGAGGALAGVVLLFVVCRLSSTKSSQAGHVMFTDDFSNNSAKWQATGDGGGEPGAGVYRIHGDPTELGGAVQSSPVKESSVSPTSPGAISIDVDARRITEPGQNASFAILCRVRGGNYYAFAIGNDKVVIAKLTTQDPYYHELAPAPLIVDPNVRTRMHAECTGDATKQHLVFWLNDRLAAQADDGDAPLSAGTVGLGVLTDPGKNSIVAEFQNFAVATVARA